MLNTEFRETYPLNREIPTETIWQGR